MDQPNVVKVGVILVGMYFFSLSQNVVQQILYTPNSDGLQFQCSLIVVMASTLMAATVASIGMVVMEIFARKSSNQTSFNAQSVTYFTPGRVDPSERASILSYPDVMKDLPLPVVSHPDQDVKQAPVWCVFYNMFYSPMCVADVLICGITLSASKCLSFHALTFLDFPTLMLGRCAKPVAIMVLSYLIRSSKQYSWKQTIEAVWMMSSLWIFNVCGPHTGGAKNTVIGNILLVIALLCDGVTGNQQDKLAVKHNLSNLQLMFGVNAVAFVVVSPFALYLETQQFYNYAAQTDTCVAGLVLAIGCLCAIGQIFVYAGIVELGAMRCSMLSSSRRLIGVLVSLSLSNTVVTPVQVGAMVSVFMAMVSTLGITSTRLFCQ